MGLVGTPPDDMGEDGNVEEDEKIVEDGKLKRDGIKTNTILQALVRNTAVTVCRYQKICSP